ncbi:MAG: hypothetical protein AB1744_08825 [Candidatus Zixiibacteriota bacterium]
MAWVEIVNEVRDSLAVPKDWTMCFQDCIYHYDDATPEPGYRFIWRRPDGSLQAARGQARIEDEAMLYRLLHQAIQAGWFKPDQTI